MAEDKLVNWKRCPLCTADLEAIIPIIPSENYGQIKNYKCPRCRTDKTVSWMSIYLEGYWVGYRDGAYFKHKIGSAGGH